MQRDIYFRLKLYCFRYVRPYILKCRLNVRGPRLAPKAVDKAGRPTGDLYFFAVTPKSSWPLRPCSNSLRPTAPTRQRRIRRAPPTLPAPATGGNPRRTRTNLCSTTDYQCYNNISLLCNVNNNKRTAAVMARGRGSGLKRPVAGDGFLFPGPEYK